MFTKLIITTIICTLSLIANTSLADQTLTPSSISSNERIGASCIINNTIYATNESLSAPIDACSVKVMCICEYGLLSCDPCPVPYIVPQGPQLPQIPYQDNISKTSTNVLESTMPCTLAQQGILKNLATIYKESYEPILFFALLAYAGFMTIGFFFTIIALAKRSQQAKLPISFPPAYDDNTKYVTIQ